MFSATNKIKLQILNSLIAIFSAKCNNVLKDKLISHI